MELQDNQEDSFLELTPHPWSYSEHQCSISRKDFESAQALDNHANFDHISRPWTNIQFVML